MERTVQIDGTAEQIEIAKQMVNEVIEVCVGLCFTLWWSMFLLLLYMIWVPKCYDSIFNNNSHILNFSAWNCYVYKGSCPMLASYVNPIFLVFFYLVNVAYNVELSQFLDFVGVHVCNVLMICLVYSSSISSSTVVNWAGWKLICFFSLCQNCRITFIYLKW